MTVNGIVLTENTKMHRTLFAIAALATLGVGAAHGQDFEVNQETVKTAGIDMSNKDAVQGLLNRLEQASLHVCGAPSGSDRHYVETVKRSDCYEKALSAAVAAVHAPTMNEVYAERTQKTAVPLSAR